SSSQQIGLSTWDQKAAQQADRLSQKDDRSKLQRSRLLIPDNSSPTSSPHRQDHSHGTHRPRVFFSLFPRGVPKSHEWQINWRGKCVRGLGSPHSPSKYDPIYRSPPRGVSGSGRGLPREEQNSKAGFVGKESWN